jgi:hypothetical protein
MGYNKVEVVFTNCLERPDPIVPGRYSTIDDFYIALDELKAKMEELVQTSSAVIAEIPGWINGERTIVFGWDGSKEGWTESGEGDYFRQKFVDLCLAHGHKCLVASYDDDNTATAQLLLGTEE